MLDKLTIICGNPEFSGPGFIAGQLSGDPNIPDGIVTVNGTPAARQVEVRERVSRRVVAVVCSNPDGTYLINGLNPALEFDVIARDWKREYNDVIVPAVRPHPYS